MPLRPSQGGSDAPAEVPDGDWPVLSAPPGPAAGDMTAILTAISAILTEIPPS